VEAGADQGYQARFLSESYQAIADFQRTHGGLDYANWFKYMDNDGYSSGLYDVHNTPREAETMYANLARIGIIIQVINPSTPTSTPTKTPSPTATSVQPSPGTWTPCATEGSNCTFSGTQAVAFGANGHFTYGSFTGGASCNTGTFGDPAPGSSKSCYTSTTMIPPSPGAWTPCATEGGTCSFSGTQAVAFGANGHFAYGSFGGDVSCAIGPFGGDPAPGTTKSCYTSTTMTGLPTTTPTATPTQSL